MSKYVGTTSRGIRLPIIKNGDDLASIVVDSVLTASENEPFPIKDRDGIASTESVVARSQGNYATVDDIAKDIEVAASKGMMGTPSMRIGDDFQMGVKGYPQLKEWIIKHGGQPKYKMFQ